MKPSLLTSLAFNLVIVIAFAAGEKKHPKLRNFIFAQAGIKPGYCGAVLENDMVTGDDGYDLDYTNVDDLFRVNDDFPLNDLCCWQ